MFNLSDIGGFVFDCDGTLLDTLAAWEEAERELFAQAGPLTQEQEDEIHAAPIEQACELLHERYGVGESAEGVLAHLDGHLIPYYGEVSSSMPGAVEFVRKVREAGIPCVVLSSSPRRYLAAGLQRAGILDCFDELVSTDETGFSKQEFGIYEAALKVLGCERERVWAVDDAPYAIAVMHDFGFKTICVGSRDSAVADMNPKSFLELL
ncbi:MAG: HAD family phosphatase [Eggerthellaceae bacterium]|nr:HAD family phosphatase [Eggerthellaceae bacterium]